MTETSTLDAVARKYDASGHVSDVFNEGQVHLSYWYGERDRATMQEASRRVTRKIADLLDLAPGDRVLDAGCGLGAPAELLAVEYGVAVRGVTASPVECERAEQRRVRSTAADRLRFTVADYGDLPDEDGSVDAVLAVESLQCTADLPGVLAELRRVLRPGGSLGVVEYTRRRGTSEREAERFAASVDIVRLRSLDEWSDALEEAGFAVEETTECGPRVFGMAHRFSQSARAMSSTLDAAFGPEMASGLATGLEDFFLPSARTIGYGLIAARSPGGSPT